MRPTHDLVEFLGILPTRGARQVDRQIHLQDIMLELIFLLFGRHDEGLIEKSTYLMSTGLVPVAEWGMPFRIVLGRTVSSKEDVSVVWRRASRWPCELEEGDGRKMEEDGVSSGRDGGVGGLEDGVGREMRGGQCQ